RTGNAEAQKQDDVSDLHVLQPRIMKCARDLQVRISNGKPQSHRQEENGEERANVMDGVQTFTERADLSSDRSSNFLRDPRQQALRPSRDPIAIAPDKVSRSCDQRDDAEQDESRPLKFLEVRQVPQVMGGENKIAGH